MKRISNIVFTKNRPMQFHGYMESLHRFFPAEEIQTSVLYKPELFEAEYDSCFSRFPDSTIIRETDFHHDLLNIVEAVDNDYILFGIDDVVFFESVSLDIIDKTFSQLGREVLGFSLRHGDALLKRCGDDVLTYPIDGQEVSAFNWTRGKTVWTEYPFDLCATIYRTEDIKRIFSGTMKGGDRVHKLFAPGMPLTNLMTKVYSRRKLLKVFGYFFNPNTLESWCCRHVQDHSTSYGNLLAYQKHCASAIQVNMVNTSTVNEWDDSVNLTVEALNEKYQQGWRIDIDAVVEERPTQTHLEHESFKMKKEAFQER